MDARVMSKSTVTRRGFVAAAGVAAAAIAAPLSAHADGADIVWDRECDVLVAGCGAAGAAAAIEAHDAGAEVLVIELADWIGGACRRSGGGVAGSGTIVQEALGVDDDPEDFADFLMAASEGLADEEVVRKFALGSGSTIEWLINDLGGLPANQWVMAGEDNGMEFDYGPGLNVGAHDSFGAKLAQRCHWFAAYEDDPILQEPEKYFPYPTGGGTGLWKVLGDALEERGVEILTETPLARLVTTPSSNEVVGVIAKRDGADYYIKARKGVILTTGNFTSNHDMYLNYTGREPVLAAGGGVGLDLAYENDGSGCKAAMALGAELVFPCLMGTYPLGSENEYSMGCPGIRVDSDARVIDVFGEQIPRLYAAGVLGGGLIVKNYPMCGGSIGRALFYGRVAGADAAALDAIAE